MFKAKPLSAKHLIQGDQAEKVALDYLKKHQLQLVEQNYHSRYGEIDLIMLEKHRSISDKQEQKTLVFVEVRYRKSTSFGSAAETVGYQKQQKIIKTAQVFLQNDKKYQQLNCRFDVVSVTLEQQKMVVDWLTDAFQAS